MANAATTTPSIDDKSQWFVGDIIDFGTNDVYYKSLRNSEQISKVSGARTLDNMK